MAFLFLNSHTYCPIRGPESFTVKQHLPLVLSRSPAPISFDHKILLQIMVEQLPMLQNCWRIREQYFQDTREGKKEEKNREKLDTWYCQLNVLGSLKGTKMPPVTLRKGHISHPIRLIWQGETEFEFFTSLPVSFICF